jgi:hypothetical protein
MKVNISGVEHTIPPKTTNKTLTSLTLMGDDSYNYGANLLENIIRLNEHFYNSEPPNKPIDGQLYYNGTDLKLFHSNQWNDVVDQPLKETMDIIYLDDNPNNVSGALIDTFLSDLISLTGYTKNNIDIVLPDEKPSSLFEAVTKKYVDKALTYPNLFNLVPNTGNPSMSGQIKLTDVDTSDSDLVTASVKFVKDMGLLDIYSDNKNPEKYRVSTYRLIDRAGESSTNYKDYFTTVWYQTTIPAYEKSVEVNLPVAFTEATTKDKNYDYSMIVNCSPVDTFDILSVEITSNKSFKIYRADTTEDLFVQGTVMGFTDKSGKGGPYDICPLPTPIPTPVPTPTPAPVVPEVSIEPTPSPSPSPSASGSPIPTPSPSPSESEPGPTPSPSPSESEPGPTPSPSPSPSVSASPSPSPTPSPTPSKSAAMTKDCRDDSNVTMIDGAATATGSAGYKVITGNQGLVTLTYDPKNSPDRIDLRNSSTGVTLASTGTATNASKPGTLTCSSSQLFAGTVLAIVVTASDKNNIDFSYCIEYAGGLTKIS